jgi:hypothetical protein
VNEDTQVGKRRNKKKEYEESLRVKSEREVERGYI